MSISVTGMTSDKFAEIYNDELKYPTLEDVATASGMTLRQVKNKAAGLRGHFARGYKVPELIMRSLDGALHEEGSVEIETLEEKDEPIEQLVERICEYNDRLLEIDDARQLIDVNLHIDGPFGVVGLPDQHLNNPGTQLRLALEHAEIIRDTEGLYCIAVGDWLDNFIIGRLERERRHDKMSHSDSVRLQEHYVSIIADKLVAAIGGNHNDWVENLGGTDVLGQLFKRLNRGGIYHADQVRVRLNTRSGHSFIHMVRHTFPGHSKYNTAHGVLSWMLDRWSGEDVFWGGHIHSSAHVALDREFLGESRVAHGIQLATYKKKDGYAIKRGFRKNVPFLAPMIVHDPRDGSSTFFEDIGQGTRYLNALRAGVV